MNWKATVAMVAVAAGLGAYVYFVESPKPAPTESNEVTIWSYDGEAAKKLDRLTLKTPKGEALYQKAPASGSVEGEWTLASQPDRDLETWQFDTPLKDALTLKAERKVEDSVSDPAVYGFDAPQLELAVGTEKEPRKSTLIVGAKNPLGSAYYAKGPDGKVYLVNAFKVDTWTRLQETPPLAAPRPAEPASGSAE
ncbi:hypothetical protein D3C72_196050 [compost metagenome]